MTMHTLQHNLWEDDEFVYVPEKLFKHLPKEYRDLADARKQEGENILRIVDNDLNGLIRLINAIPTASSLGYIFHRLRTSNLEITADIMMDQEILTTAFIVTYARLFASNQGTRGITRKDVPDDLKSVHDEIMELRNKRYAHNGSHHTLSSGINIIFDDDGFQIKMEMSYGLYLGGKDEWKKLITFIDSHMHDRLMKILSRLEKKTGKKWTIPSGPAPHWVDN